jgi:acyl-CoA thioesterase-1
MLSGLRRPAVKSCPAAIIAALLGASPLLGASGCGGGSRDAAPGAHATSPAPTTAPTSEAPVVMFVGTSLTAGLGVSPDEAYPALIQQRIDAAGLPFRVVNAGVSGETSAGARRRLDWLLSRRRVAVLVIETGANDGLRAQDPDATRANIEAMLERAAREDPPPRVVLIGMQAPPNYGPEYARRFRALYPELAAKHHVALVPFLLQGVGGVATLNQADGVHPTPEGHRIMADTVWKVFGPLLQSLQR